MKSWATDPGRAPEMCAAVASCGPPSDELGALVVLRGTRGYGIGRPCRDKPRTNTRRTMDERRTTNKNEKNEKNEKKYCVHADAWRLVELLLHWPSSHGFTARS